MMVDGATLKQSIYYFNSFGYETPNTKFYISKGY